MARGNRLFAPTVLAIALVGVGCGDEKVDPAAGGDSDGDGAGTVAGAPSGGGGLPNPCTLVADGDLAAAIGADVQVDGPFDDGGNVVTDFPSDAESLTCTWIAAGSSGSVVVFGDTEDFQFTCELTVAEGEVDGDVCVGTDISSTSDRALVRIDGAYVDLLASGPDADPAVEGLVDALTG